MGNFVSMFTGLEGYEEFEEEVQLSNKKKRGPYHKHSKPYLYDEYSLISDLYCKIANYLPIPIGVDEDVITESFGLRSWYTVDFDEDNKEPPLRLFQAEIIGTETFDVSDRIFLHTNLLNFLGQKIDLKDAVQLLNNDLQRIKRKYTLSEHAKWLKKQREHTQNQRLG